MKHLKFSYVGPISGLQKAIQDQIAIDKALARCWESLPNVYKMWREVMA